MPVWVHKHNLTFYMTAWRKENVVSCLVFYVTIVKNNYSFCKIGTVHCKKNNNPMYTEKGKTTERILVNTWSHFVLMNLSELVLISLCQMICLMRDIFKNRYPYSIVTAGFWPKHCITQVDCLPYVPEFGSKYFLAVSKN